MYVSYPIKTEQDVTDTTTCRYNKTKINNSSLKTYFKTQTKNITDVFASIWLIFF